MKNIFVSAHQQGLLTLCSTLLSLSGVISAPALLNLVPSTTEQVGHTWPVWLQTHSTIRMPPTALIKRSYLMDDDKENKISSDVWLFLLTSDATLEDFHREAKKTGVQYRVRHEFSGDLVHGLSVRIIGSAEDHEEFFQRVSNLASIPSVQTAWPNIKFARPSAKVTPLAAEDPLANIKFTKSAEFPAMASITGVAKVHSELGIKGKGIKVGVIDTGIYYKHQALGGCFGKGCKVAYGKDLVGDDYTGFNDPNPDNDPLDCAGHGSHVAGIIAGTDPNSPLLGVAPEATLGAYRIFGCEGTSDSDVIIASMEHAYKDGMDVINMSLGNGPGWPEHPLAQAANRIAELGVLAAIAAGNDGTAGLYMVSIPSIAPLATSVASIDNTWILGRQIVINAPGVISAESDELYGTAAKLSNLEVVPTSAYTTSNLPDEDGCSRFPSSVNFKGKIVLIRRGTCNFSDKILNGQEKGAAGIIIYDKIPNGGAFIPVTSGADVVIPVVGISEQDGLWIIQQINAKAGAVKAVWSDTMESSPNPTGKFVSSFSSLGLAANLEMKPDIAAPGGSIYSTVPASLGYYATMSGTSMATPYIAGCMALLLQGLPWVKDIAAGDKAALGQLLLQNGATPMNYGPSSELISVPDTPVRQGAGLVNIYKTLVGKTAVFPSKLYLKDMAPPANGTTQTVDTVFAITNVDTMSHIFKVSNVLSVATNGENVNDPLYSKASGPDGTYLQVQLNLTSVTLASKEFAYVKASFILPNTAYKQNPSEWLLGGYIKVEYTDDPTKPTFIPYTALKGSANDLNMFNTDSQITGENVPLPQIYSVVEDKSFSAPVNEDSVLSKDEISMKSVATFTLSETKTGELDFPVVRFSLNYNSPLVVIRLRNAKDGSLVGDIVAEKQVVRNTLEGESPLPCYQIPFDGTVKAPSMNQFNQGSKKKVAKSVSHMLTKRSMGSLKPAFSANLLHTLRKPMTKTTAGPGTVLRMRSMSDYPTVAQGAAFSVSDGDYIIEVDAYHPLSKGHSYEAWFSPVFTIKQN